jgi:hypothetical protein
MAYYSPYGGYAGGYVNQPMMSSMPISMPVTSSYMPANVWGQPTYAAPMMPVQRSYIPTVSYSTYGSSTSESIVEEKKKSPLEIDLQRELDSYEEKFRYAIDESE